MTGSELPRLRSLLGGSTALWAGSTTVEPGRWVALSGARAVDYNVILCHSRSAIAPSIEEFAAAGVPGLMMVAGEALADVQQLAAAGWVCIAAVPFMARELDGAERPVDPQLDERDRTDSGLRELAPTELALAWELVADVFGLDPELARASLPAEALAAPGRRLWGSFDEARALTACLATVASEDAVVVWSMATSAAARGQGHGGRLLAHALADAAERGATLSLLHASEDGEPFYKAAGYWVLEYWQVWSRPRWVLGRA
jgi:GNAT superfamily N-acetyltransferase